MRGWKLEARGWKWARIFFLASSLQLPVAVQAETITITGDACAAAAEYVPGPDVQFRQGVDINGNPVAGADVNGRSRMQWPQSITIPLSLDLQKSLHLPNKYTSPQATIGTIEYKDGKVLFNGEPVSQDAQAQIQATCRNSQTPQKPSIQHKDLLKGD